MSFKRLTAACILLLVFLTNLHAQTPDIREKVDKLISEMTLDEKIGQMTQVTLARGCQRRLAEYQDGSLDPEATQTRRTGL